MGTHIKFKKKEFSKISKAVTYVKKHPTVPITAASLAVGTANLATNRSRHDRDREYQDKQLRAMNNLTNSLTNLNKNVEQVNEKRPEQKRPTFITIKRITNK